MTETRHDDAPSELVRTRLSGEPVRVKRLDIRRILAAVMVLTFLVGVGIGVFVLSHQPGKEPSPYAAVVVRQSSDLLITSNATMGKIILNGKPQPGKPPMAVTLKPGKNNITYSAPPFRDQTCTVTFSKETGVQTPGPTSSAGTCNTFTDSGVQIGDRLINNGVMFELNSSDLPDAMATQLMSALTAKLDSITLRYPVPAGDYIATGKSGDNTITSLRAQAPLTAVLRIAVDSPGVQGGSTFYPGSFPAADVPDNVWEGFVSFASWWEFIGPSGELVAKSAKLTGMAYAPIFILGQDDVWQVSDQLDFPPVGLPRTFATALANSDCNSAYSYWQSAADVARIDTSKYVLGPSAPGRNTTGCTLALAGQQDSGKRYGALIIRWGVLLAADDKAHALLPQLPVAPKSEIDAVGGLPVQ